MTLGPLSSPKQFAENNGIGVTKTYEEMNSGRLSFLKIGTLTKITPEAEAKWRRDREKDAELGESPNPKARRKAQKGRKVRAEANGAAP